MTETLTNNYIRQYKFLFISSWILFYLVFPAWALPISVSARAAVFLGLLVYFIVSAYLMDSVFSALTIEKSLIAQNINWGEHLKSNVWLLVVCCIAVIIHIYPLTHPILMFGDEPIHLQGGLLVYDYIDVGWHKVFQAILWIVVLLALITRIFKNRLGDFFSSFIGSDLLKIIFAFLFFGFLVFWFFFLKDMQYQTALVRYPPVAKIIYFLTYSAFGIHRVVPRIVQLVFYLLSAIYLYRTIDLFFEKEAALLGAVLYLFLPISFAYAHLAELPSGTIFFIVACAFYFLRFVKNEDDRDLIIATYLIGTGCLYKKLNLLLFIICVTFLVAHKIKKRDFDSFVHLKVLLISLVPIIPWMIISRNFVWRNYSFQLSNLTSFNGKIITYLTLLSSNFSGVVSIFLVLAVLYVCFFKRNALTGFFGILFTVYYFFIVSDAGYLSPRFSMAFYPTIIVFLSLFIFRMIQAIKWKHAFKLSFIVLTIYLIVISAVSPLNDRYLNIMNRKLIYFPSEDAMRWVKDNVMDGEKLIALRIMSYNFYRVKYGIDKDRLIGYWYNITDISSPEQLKEIYREKKASYIMFPYSPEYGYISDILPYLKDNRDNEFIEVERFNLDDNYIFIYKLKNT